MENHTIIETVDLKKIYGMGDAEVMAVNGISLKIGAGEFVAIMGPSGSGKSTLMNILACLDQPTEGQYILDGEDVSGYTRKELAMIRSQKLGFVFQSFNLLPRTSAIDNVMMPMIYRRENQISMAERKVLAVAAMEKVGLADRMDHMPNELSGGQQQRVAIARALINDPILLLADEPTGNLDTRSSEEIMALLHDLHERGRTIVMVTHEPDIAHHMGARAGENLFLDADDQPDPDAYLPAFVRRYPFVFAAAEGNDQLIVCIDRLAPMIGENPDVPFFDGDKPSQYTQEAIEFCSEFERQSQATQEFVKLITSMDLLEVKTVTFNQRMPDGTEQNQKIADYFAIDEAKLAALPADKLVQLRDQGALGVIYAHLISLMNWPRIVQKTLRRNEAPA